MMQAGRIAKSASEFAYAIYKSKRRLAALRTLALVEILSKSLLLLKVWIDLLFMLKSHRTLEHLLNGCSC